MANAASAATSVTTAATQITTSISGNDARIIRNNEASGGNTVYLGASNVTTTTGFPLLPQEAMEIPSGPTVIYGIVATGTGNVRALG